MDYFLTEEQLEIKEISRKVAEEKVKPLREKYDEEGIFPWDMVEVFAQTDLFAVLVPEEYGGISGKVMDLCIVTEELCRVCAGISMAMGATGLGLYPILLSGSEEQKQKYLPAIADGKRLAAFAVTEANAGSDVGAIETTATLDGDHYILNGTKQWITNGGEAEIYTVFAITDKTKGARGASCFIVEKGTITEVVDPAILFSIFDSRFILFQKVHFLHSFGQINPYSSYPAISINNDFIRFHQLSDMIQHRFCLSSIDLEEGGIVDPV